MVWGAEVFLKKSNICVFIRISYDEFGVRGNTPPLTSRNVVLFACLLVGRYQSPVLVVTNVAKLQPVSNFESR